MLRGALPQIIDPSHAREASDDAPAGNTPTAAAALSAHLKPDQGAAAVGTSTILCSALGSRRDITAVEGSSSKSEILMAFEARKQQPAGAWGPCQSTSSSLEALHGAGITGSRGPAEPQRQTAGDERRGRKEQHR